jgi:hypothetical protein
VPPVAHVNAIVAVGAAGTVTIVVGVSAVVGTTVVVAGAAMAIVFLKVFARYFFDLATFNVNLHEPVAPIINFVGFLFGVNVQVPVFDHVFTPAEFVATTADNFTTWLAPNEETFHVAFVDGAADTDSPIVIPAKIQTRSSAPVDRMEKDLK